MTTTNQRRRTIMSATTKAVVAAVLMFGSVSATLAASHHGKAERRVPGHAAVERVTGLGGRYVEVPPLPNWAFVCDPDFGPNGYNPCSDAAL